MPITDLHNDIEPKHPYRKVVEPSLSRLRKILKDASVMTDDQIDKSTRNDLIYAARVAGLSVFPLKSLAITGPDALSSGTIQLVATATYDDGSTRVVTTEGTWASSDDTKATVGASTGTVTKVAAGTTDITFTLDGITSPAHEVTVS